jgi:hypothetical protein
MKWSGVDSMNFFSQKRTDQILSQLNAEEIMSVLEYLFTDSNLSLMQRALNEKSSIDFVWNDSLPISLLNRDSTFSNPFCDKYPSFELLFVSNSKKVISVQTIVHWVISTLVISSLRRSLSQSKFEFNCDLYGKHYLDCDC